MKCQICGSDIKSGGIFCPTCGEPVQLVPDYNSVEYMIQQKQAEEVRQRELQEIKRKRQQLERRAVELKKKKRRRILLITLLLLMFLAGTIVGVFWFIQYSRDNSFDYQYKNAYEAYNAEDYSTALIYGERALELDPDNDNAIRLLAETRAHTGDIDGSIELLKMYITKYPDSVDAYARLINIYEEAQRTEDIKMLMDSCTNDIILTEFTAYIPSEIHLLTEPGSYTSKILIELDYSSGTVYYTTDGSVPDNTSEVFTDPVMLEEGSTVFKAVCYSDAGIVGDVLTAEYTVTLARPNPPFISPSSGDYESGTKITVIVPDGCKAYYAFDSIADRSGSLYVEPVTMLDGEHIFSVIVVDENGKESYPASETYVVESTGL